MYLTQSRCGIDRMHQIASENLHIIEVGVSVILVPALVTLQRISP